MRLMLVLIVLGAAVVAQAEDLKTRAGKEYKDIKVIAIEDDAIKITHTGGVARIAYEQLTDEQRSTYQLTEEGAKAAAEKRKEQKITDALAKIEALRTKQIEAAQIHVSGEVLSVTPKGVLLTDVGVFDAKLNRYFSTDQNIFVKGSFAVADKDRVRADVYPVGTIQYTSAISARLTVRCYTQSQKEYREYIGESKASKK